MKNYLIDSAMEEICESILYANSPWLKDTRYFNKNNHKPENFHRQAYWEVEKKVLHERPCGIFIKGPRRVGKTELQKQLIWHLAEGGKSHTKLNPKTILYLSFDDARIQSEPPLKRVVFVNQILDVWARKFLGADSYEEISKKVFCFFDEVQSVENWDVLIKNKLERKPEIPIVFSGSATHTLFKMAEKTLLGRLNKIIELGPFSFNEYLQKNSAFGNGFGIGVKVPLHVRGQEFKADFDVPRLYQHLHEWSKNHIILSTKIQKKLTDYLLDGGFPQLWKMRKMSGSSLLEQYQFMDENYVKKTTLEDLMLLQQIKKPELYERLFRHLFARPGQEYNLNKTAGELGTTAVTMAEAMRLLEQTDLFIFAERYSSKSAPIKKRNVKIYPVDLQLTTAITKKIASLRDDNMKGAIAESLVAQALRRLFGSSYRLAFMRSDAFENAGEVDFLLQHEAGSICPIEVKYQNNLNPEDYVFMKNILQSKNALEMTFSSMSCGIIITPNKWGYITDGCNIFCIPLWAFLLIA